MSGRLSREELMEMLYRACCLYVGACGLDTPDWVRAVSGANPEMLEAAIEVAWEFLPYEDQDEE